jgi:PAS domain S-box-containing protein
VTRPNPSPGPRISHALALTTLSAAGPLAVGVSLATSSLPALPVGIGVSALCGGLSLAWWWRSCRQLQGQHAQLRRHSEQLRRVSMSLPALDADPDPLRGLIHTIATGLEATVAVIAEHNDAGTLRTVTQWHQDGQTATIDWQRGPWLEAIEHGQAVIADGHADPAVCAAFAVRTCIGVPLDGRKAVLVVGFNHRLDNALQTQEAVQVAATRCTAELHRRRADQAMARSLKLFDALFEDTQLLTMLLEREGPGWRVTRVNQATADTLGMSRDDMLAMAHSPSAPLTEDLLGVEVKAVDPSMPDRPLHAVMEEALLINGAEYLMRRRDGATRRIMLSAAPIVDSAGGVDAALCFGQDVTERHALREQVRQSQKMDAVGQLAGGIAHDFNNMLGSVMGYCEIMLLDEDLDAGVRDAAEAVIRIVERAGDLTHRLLTFSRTGEMQRIPVGVHRCIDDTLILLRQKVDPTIEIVVEKHADRDQIIGDPGLITGSLLNLCRNGIDAMSQAGTLKIRSDTEYISLNDCQRGAFELEPGAYCTITVTDTGEGIAPELLERIFEPFFTTRQQQRGTGLGLPTVYGAMEQHGGAVTVVSEPGAGSTFTVYLPLASETAVHRSSGAQVIPGNGTVLVIDDEEPILDIASRLLEHIGYQSITCAEAEQGVATFAKHHAAIDLVILDMVMPTMHGREVLIKLREIDPEVKVLVASGFPRDTDPAQLKAMGAAGFLQKPFRLTDLSRSMGEILGILPS